MRKMRLFQKDSYVGIDFLDKKTEIIKYKTAEDKNVFSFDVETNHGKKTIAISSPVIKENNAIKTELQSFINAINANKRTVVSEIDGYRAMEVAHMILEKIRRNQLAWFKNSQIAKAAKYQFVCHGRRAWFRNFMDPFLCDI